MVAAGIYQPRSRHQNNQGRLAGLIAPQGLAARRRPRSAAGVERIAERRCPAQCSHKPGARCFGCSELVDEGHPTGGRAGTDR